MAVVSTYQSKFPYIISTYILEIYMDHMHQYSYRKNTHAENWIQVKICERIILALMIHLWFC